jgi:hypothetical protein
MAVSGVAHPQGGWPATVFYPLGHPAPYVYGRDNDHHESRRGLGTGRIPVIGLFSVTEMAAGVVTALRFDFNGSTESTRFIQLRLRVRMTRNVKMKITGPLNTNTNSLITYSIFITLQVATSYRLTRPHLQADTPGGRGQWP